MINNIQAFGCVKQIRGKKVDIDQNVYILDICKCDDISALFWAKLD
jgi:hypothetical protein